jgi:DMSO/TMAO reductase YedYZ molybdopterin-dependent catalytic subunit
MGERTRGFWIGVTAGAFAIFLSFLLRILFGGLFVPELAAQTLFSITPGEIESRAVETLGAFAKYSALVGAVFVNLALYGVLGTLLQGLRSKLASKGYIAKALGFSLLAYLILLLASITFLEVTEIATQPTSIQSAALFLIPAQLVFGFALTYLSGIEFRAPSFVREETPVAIPRIDRRRRLLIRAAAAGAVASIILFYGLDLFFPSSQQTPTSEVVTPPSETRGIFADPMLASFVASEVTANERFYKVDVNVTPPAVDVDTWKLSVGGLVDNPLTLSYAELKAMQAVNQYNTLECVSNEIGGDLISNALWKGVRLKDLLEKAQVKPGAVYVVFGCADSYDVGIPLERALLDGTILVYEMNGAPLPPEHGRPLRVIVPGLYGMMNAKWATDIQVVDKVHQGFWQRRGWSNDAAYQTHSTIVVPGDSPVRSRFVELGASQVLANRKEPIAGIAFAGDRGILKVEVSTDGGSTWETASLKDPLSGYTWVFWATEWNPPTKGNYQIMVRATDKTGKIQTANLQQPFPSGATGYHVVDVTVESTVTH